MRSYRWENDSAERNNGLERKGEIDEISLRLCGSQNPGAASELYSEQISLVGSPGAQTWTSAAPDGILCERVCEIWAQHLQCVFVRALMFWIMDVLQSREHFGWRGKRKQHENNQGRRLWGQGRDTLSKRQRFAELTRWWVMNRELNLFSER